MKTLIFIQSKQIQRHAWLEIFFRLKQKPAKVLPNETPDTATDGRTLTNR